MNFTFVVSDNTAGNAQVLGAAGQDIYVKKVIFGTGTDGKAVVLYNKRVAYGSASGIGSCDSADIAVKLVQPTAGAGKDYLRVVDFGEPGIQLDGGSFHTDNANVTVVWEPVDEAKG